MGYRQGAQRTEAFDLIKGRLEVRHGFLARLTEVGGSSQESEGMGSSLRGRVFIAESQESIEHHGGLVEVPPHGHQEA